MSDPHSQRTGILFGQKPSRLELRDWPVRHRLFLYGPGTKMDFYIFNVEKK